MAVSDAKTHWEKIYGTKAPEQVSWYRPHLERSLSLIERAAGSVATALIDVGGGESTLVDDLLARGYENITVLDISQTAIDVTKKRLKETAERVHWIIGASLESRLNPRLTTFGMTALSSTSLRPMSSGRPTSRG